jgi:hypothetical protein
LDTNIWDIYYNSNDQVAHTVHTCKEQGIDLPIQAVGDTVTTAWPTLMRDLEDKAQARALEDYKDLADNASSLKAELKASQAALTSECSRVERRDEMICDLKDVIAALRRPQSTASTATLSAQPIAQSLHAVGPSSHPTAPLPARAKLGLATWMSNPGLASRMEMCKCARTYSSIFIYIAARQCIIMRIYIKWVTYVDPLYS